jgi:hypothetical protein
MEDSADRQESLETVTSQTPPDEAPPVRAKAKVNEEQPSMGSVNLADIRKAVGFTNSVGGLDNAIALLQILKVAKEVQ